MEEERLSWNSWFKQIAEITAKRSPCKRLHVGCLLVKDKRIVSQGYNGYLPGSLDEKMEPWLVPIRSNMRKVYNKPAILQKMESDEDIELVSLSHFRGRTFDDACVIVDEFQNLNFNYDTKN